MIKASELLDFEKAAKYRDIINNIKAITTKQLLENQDEKSKDIIKNCKFPGSEFPDYHGTFLRFSGSKLAFCTILIKFYRNRVHLLT